MKLPAIYAYLLTQEADESLLGRVVQKRDQEAFASLVLKYEGMVRGVCHGELRDWNDVDDAGQATFTSLWEQAGKIKDGTRLAGWLRTVAKRAARKIRTARDRERAGTSLPPVAVAPPRLEECDTVRTESSEVLKSEIDRLSLRLQIVFVMRHLYDVPTGNIAEQLGLNLSQVDNRLHRAKARLAERLRARGFAPAVAIGVLATPASTAAYVRETVRVALAYAAGRRGDVPARVATVADGLLRSMGFARSLFVGAGIAIAVVAAAGPSVSLATHRPPRGPDVPPEIARNPPRGPDVPPEIARNPPRGPDVPPEQVTPDETGKEAHFAYARGTLLKAREALKDAKFNDARVRQVFGPDYDKKVETVVLSVSYDNRGQTMKVIIKVVLSDAFPPSVTTYTALTPRDDDFALLVKGLLLGREGDRDGFVDAAVLRHNPVESPDLAAASPTCFVRPRRYRILDAAPSG